MGKNNSKKKNIEKSHLYFCRCFFAKKNKNKHNNEQIKENDTIFLMKMQLSPGEKKNNTDFCFYTTEIIHSLSERKKKHMGHILKLFQCKKKKTKIKKFQKQNYVCVCKIC